jgi:hypothetical protein
VERERPVEREEVVDSQERGRRRACLFVAVEVLVDFIEIKKIQKFDQGGISLLQKVRKFLLKLRVKKIRVKGFSDDQTWARVNIQAKK